MSLPRTAWLVCALVMAPAQVQVHAEEPGRGLSRMAGAMASQSVETRFVTVGSRVDLAINGAAVVKGDRLDIYQANDRAGDTTMEMVGQLIVTSPSGTDPAGEVTLAYKEIYPTAYVSLTLPESLHLNPYLPFMQTMADTYLDNPILKKLRVAVVDVVDVHGNITGAGESIFADVRRFVCARAQFDCVDARTLASALGKYGVYTSANIDRETRGKMLANLKCDIVVTGIYRRVDNGLELILLAQSTHPADKRRQVWRKLLFPRESGPGGSSIEDRVTVRYRRIPKGHLKISLSQRDTIDGMKAEYFHYEDFRSLVKKTEATGARLEAARFFADVDGRRHLLRADGLLFNEPVSAGKHRVVIGYYPESTAKTSMERSRMETVRKVMDLYVGEHEIVSVVVCGTIEKGFGLIAADIDFIRDPS